MRLRQNAVRFAVTLVPDGVCRSANAALFMHEFMRTRDDILFSFPLCQNDVHNRNLRYASMLTCKRIFDKALNEYGTRFLCADLQHSPEVSCAPIPMRFSQAVA